MKRKSILASAAVAAALIAAVGTTAASHDDDHGGSRSRRLKADLKGIREVPVVSTSGSRVVPRRRNQPRRDGDRIPPGLLRPGGYGDRQTPVHVGDHHTNGGISLWLCGTSGITGPAGNAGPGRHADLRCPGGLLSQRPRE